MYIPSAFCVEDEQTITDFIKYYPFETLITKSGSNVTHLPLIRRPDGNLEGHFARGNQHASELQSDETEVIAIFHGPHAYISPMWYSQTQDAVPTWNYAVVHIHGIARPFVSEEELRNHLIRLVEIFEAHRSPRWRLSDVSENAFRKLSAAICGFIIEPKRIEAKFKLGQNRKREDMKGYVAALSDSDLLSEREFAKFAANYLNLD